MSKYRLYSFLPSSSSSDERNDGYWVKEGSRRAHLFAWVARMHLW